MATFQRAEKYGIERGMPTLRDIELAGAEARSTSCSSGSVVASPVATLTTIRKNEIRNAVKMAGMVPMPNQMMRMGTTATFGTALKAIITG